MHNRFRWRLHSKVAEIMLYYLSIGSNVAPEFNIARIIKQLSQKYGEIICYPCVYTIPEGIKSQSIFINSLCIFQSDMSIEKVKLALNLIEEDLGRNREDPDSSKIDRPADLDIMGVSEKFKPEIFSSQRNKYIEEILAYRSAGIADLSIYGLPVFQRPATINFDTATGDIRILNDATNRLVDGAEPAFLFQRGFA